ncbi:hypothetical protein [Aliikangiella sp. IMCC44359]|uniref:hypothetical protein n=1 Tax=Aliikangiella sp. IMCC44359 TaxID=3459125 RepID=UPI00403B353C
MNIRHICLLIFFLLLTCSAFAKKPLFFKSIVEDKNNYIYFVTHTGIVRFDGYQYINLSDISKLPTTWVESAVYREESNTLYIAFFKEGIWTLDLSTNHAKKISDLFVTKIALSNSHLMAIVDKSLYMFDLFSLKTYQHPLKDVIDIAADKNQHFAITKTGLYKVNDQHLWPIKSFQTTKAHLALLHHRLAYSTDYQLTLLSLKDDTELATRKFESEITAVAPYQLNSIAVAYNSNVDILNNTDLDTIKASVNKLNQSNRVLYEDKQGNLWATDYTQFEVIDPHSTLFKFSKPSRYNVLEMVNDQLWLGTEHGLYYVDKGTFKPLTEINNLFPPLERRITDIVYAKNSPIIITTATGAYRLENKTLTKIRDGFIISASYIDSKLMLSTTKGIVGFDKNFNALNLDTLNKALPNEEVIKVSKIAGVLYVMTSGGLVEQTQNNISVSKVSQHNIADIFTSGGNIYVATWGGGLFKKAGSEWISIDGPQSISSAFAYFDEVLLSASDGLYRFKDEKITLVPNSAGQMFIPNSIVTENYLAHAASNKGLITVDLFNTPSLAPPKFTQFPTSDIPYNQTVTVSVNNFDYINGHAIRYQYKLNNGDWIEMPNGQVQISYLNTGTHKMMVRASYNGIQWQNSITRSFNITGPWYRSDSFALFTTLLLSIGSLVSLIAIFMFFKVNRQKNKVFKELSQQQTKRGLLEVFSKLVAAKNALNSDNPILSNNGLLKVDQAVSKIESLLDNYSVLSALDNSRLETSLQGLETLIIAQGVAYDFQLSICKRCSQETRNTIFYIAHTLIFNSLKHANAKFIQLNINCGPKNIKICVRDDGKGIKYTDHKFNFGVGIATLKNIAYERKGKIKFKGCHRGKSKGTFVSVVLPYSPSKDKVKLYKEQKVNS